MERSKIEKLYRCYLECGMEVSTDSRRVGEGVLFFALVGDRFDGNEYALSALEKGAKYAVVSRPELAEREPRCLLVEDTLLALQALASHHRDQYPHLKVLGITGTNGKTTTKELTATILTHAEVPTLYTEGNLNNHIGVPLTLLRLRPEHQVAIIEMGASKRGDIKELVEIAHPSVGVITNVGRAHLEGFGSQQGILETKSELFDYLQAHHGMMILNMDDTLLRERWQGSESIGFGITTHSTIQGAEVACDPYLKMKLLIHGEPQPITSQLVGKYNAYNVLAATALATSCGISPDKVAEAIASYHPSNHRSQLVVGQKGRQIIADAYNANPSSMMEALKNILAQHSAHKLVLLGDMRELGKDSPAEHQRIIDWLTHHPEITPLLCGEEFAKVAQEGMQHFPTNSDLEHHLQEIKELPTDLVILVKGSNGIGLEKLLPLLETMINN